jgi:hypothetical protein
MDRETRQTSRIFAGLSLLTAIGCSAYGIWEPSRSTSALALICTLIAAAFLIALYDPKSD